MKVIGKIYKSHLMDGLRELADINYQRAIWLNLNNPNRWVGSFTEAAIGTFDDSLADNALETGQVIFDANVTHALRELKTAVDAVDEFRPEEEIINDPLMEVVRAKAADALQLIQISDGKGGNVQMIELGTPAQ